MVIHHLKQIGKVKKLTKWMLHELIKNQNYHCLECCLLSFYTTITNHFLIGLWHMMKSRLYMTTGNDQLSGWIEKKLQSTSQSQICTKKRVFVTGGLLPVWSTTAFWIPVKPLHLRSTLSKSMRYTESCKACSWHWSTERAQFFSTTMPDHHMLHNQCFKSWTNWAMKLCLIHHIHLTSCQPNTTSNLDNFFCRKNASTTSRWLKMLFKSSLNPEAQIFTLQKQTNLFPIGKNMLIN